MGSIPTLNTHANVAQQAEQLFCKQPVVGSIPIVSSNSSNFFVKDLTTEDFVEMRKVKEFLCLGDGTGIHFRLKIGRPKGIAGSTPARGTSVQRVLKGI